MASRGTDSVFEISKLVPCLITVEGDVETVSSDRGDEPPSLAQLQKWVGGFIEVLPLGISQNSVELVMVVDEEAKCKPNARPNTLASFQYRHSDIYGPALICRSDWIE